ncbi:MAG: FAD-binding oxidoreductase [Leptospiraceae bacterium]|nr:FAD-binding oxidoreductase [Leptospiraceae bacterium]
MVTKEVLGKFLNDEDIFLKGDGKMDDGLFLSYGIDRTKLHTPDYEVLLFPRTTEEVAKIVSYAYESGISIVPSGGRTGYAGGAIAKNKEIVISLSKLNSVLDFDPFFASLTVGAGMITAELHKQAEERGYFFPVDFAASGSSHIGGNVATNAGGVRVVRYGLTRNWVLGMKVVTGTGEVLDFNGDILKNNTGYDLKHLFIGSEGTLGIITEITVKLTKIPKNTNVILLAVPEYKMILEIFKESHNAKLPLLAFEFFTEHCLNQVVEHLGVNRPFSTPSEYYVLLEFEAEENESEHLYSFLEEVTNKELITDGSVAQNSTQKKTFWKYREGISESLSILHTVHKNDISLPLREMEPFLKSMEELLNVKYPGFEIALFGHIGDGNLHLNILKPKEMSNEDFFTSCKKVDPEMFALVKKHNGSISAEHGIGLLKKDFLNFSRSQTEIQLMRQIKSVFDPKGILNPGKVLPEII